MFKKLMIIGLSLFAVACTEPEPQGQAIKGKALYEKFAGKTMVLSVPGVRVSSTSIMRRNGTGRTTLGPETRDINWGISGQKLCIDYAGQMTIPEDCATVVWKSGTSFVMYRTKPNGQRQTFIGLVN